jgi:proteasome lid subunit RPN8/RPN11
MASLIATLARIVFGPRPEIICAAKIWNEGVIELRRRAGGRRESGAFLLGSGDGARRIEEFVFYDDVDPDSLSTGIVVIDGRRLGDLWSYCRKTGRKVVADVHVHPGGYAQSTSDQANPIMAEVGHVAIILPDFAQRSTAPGGIGFYRYLGSRKWRDQSREFPRPMHVGWWPQWR